MFAYRGKTALVTGASSGIGEALARALARRGMQLILVARSKEKLVTLAEEFADRYRTRAEVIAIDLGRDGSARQVYEETERLGMPVDMLVNNAGFSNYGHFEDVPLDRDHQQMMVDVAALVDLTHAFVPGMLERGAGVVVNVASIVSFWPLPYQSVYGASKAFILSFSQALAVEYQGRGIQVLALCPGSTATSFFVVSDAHILSERSSLLGRMRSPEQVALTAIKALEQGKVVAVDGVPNALLTRIQRFVPPLLLARATAKTIRPRDRRFVIQPERAKSP
ncbi:MAG: putative oxidoreductase [Chloroflexi bacterium]|nr:putative oxidoreductase [Chloroflexota bacterium]